MKDVDWLGSMMRERCVGLSVAAAIVATVAARIILAILQCLMNVLQCGEEKGENDDDRRLDDE